MITIFHIYADENRDEWTRDSNEAQSIYKQLIQDGFYTVHLHQEIYADEESVTNDFMLDEECVQSTDDMLGGIQ